ncbi:TPA: DUF4176 domain-containing protein [Streptococcus equi subsp. zooepidemicus]|nr:DUF4176 domain-containing protein [Streptococcus equi subsp. zooepidemicus]
MNKPEHILPIGTIVLTETGEIPLMIVSRASLFDDNGEIGYFDYAAVPYPEGIGNDNEYLFFNYEDIADVIYFGYVNSNEQLFAEAYDDLVKTSGYRKLSLDHHQ